MRLLAVMAGVVVGISGCFGAPLVHRAPAGNETADPSGGGAGDAPPWTLNGTSDKVPDVGDEKSGAQEKSGEKKPGDAGDPGGNNTGNSTDPPPPAGNETVIPFGEAGVGSPEQIIDEADDDLPTEGSPEDSVEQKVEDASDDASDTEDPTGDTTNGVVSTAEKQTGQDIPDTDSLLFDS